VKIDAQATHLERFSRWKTYLILLILLLVMTIILSLNLGFSQISFLDILKIFIKNVPFIGNFAHFSNVQVVEEIIIIQIRLPRILSGALVGAALAASGVIYQGVFRNPMADPYVIGASSGAALGASLAIVLGLGFALLGVNTIPVFAFLGCLASVLLVYFISRVGSRVPVTTLLLSGISISIFLSAIVTYMQTIAGERLHALTFWLMGGFSYIEWKDVWSVLPFIFVGIGVTYLYSRDLNLLVLGEDQAEHLGVELEKTKLILLVSSALMTAAAVSISGLIGFIGLIIPHLTRLLTGPDHRVLLPASVILGASFMVICDGLARVIASPAEVPVGVITAVCGGPFFIYLLRRKRKIDAY
jgi:iron complex transport system permease protein